MKKKEIIKDNREFSRIINKNKNVKNKYYSIYYEKNNSKNLYGISVPTKTGNAVIRNKLKRQVKNIIDNNKNYIQSSYNYVIILRKNLLDLDYQSKEKELINLFKRLENNMTKKKIILVLISVFMLTGCTTILKDKDNKTIVNPETGQSITENIICKPTDEKVVKIYEENGVDIKDLPSCNNFNPVSKYEGLWTTFFVKPLAWVIIQIGNLVNSYGLSIIITAILIRLVLMPITKKTAMQSENMKKAQPEIEKLEKKYKGKESQEDQMRKTQEMLAIYQKYQINPVSGCLLAFIQLPLLFAFLEAINRTPAIFESKFLGLQMATTTSVGIQNGNYIYILFIVLILGTTYLSFRKTLKDQTAAAAQMKYTIYIMLGIIFIGSLTLPTALGIYWITSSTFTIFQNMWVERKKVK